MCKKRLCGAKIVLLDCNCHPIACGITNEEGELCFDCLPMGKYFIKEEEAPKGYKGCSELVCVEVTCESPNKFVELFNEKIMGKIKIVKCGDK